VGTKGPGNAKKKKALGTKDVPKGMDRKKGEKNKANSRRAKTVSMSLVLMKKKRSGGRGQREKFMTLYRIEMGEKQRLSTHDFNKS